MSWFVSAIGKSQAVKSALAEKFGEIECSEPEQTIKNNVSAAIALALSYYPANIAVEVSASGAQSDASYCGGEKGEYINGLSISIEPKWSFVE